MVAALLPLGDATADEVDVATAMLASQPPSIRERLVRDRMIVLVSAVDPNDPDPESSEAIVGFVIFERSPAETYRLLSQTARQIEYRSELSAIENVEWTQHGPVDQHRIKILFQRFDYHLAYHLDAQSRQIHWQLDPDYENDLSIVEGSWELMPYGNGDTLARFTTRVEVAGGVPRFVQDYFTRKNLPSTLGNCRRWVDSDGRYRP